MKIISSAIGWLCLLIWYRDIEKMDKLVEEEYAGHYYLAGEIFVLNFIAGLGAVTLTGVVIAVLAGWIYRSIVN